MIRSPFQWTLAAALALSPLAAQAQDARQMTLSKEDQMFARKAAHANAEEIELGRMATTQAASADVKSFGQRMVDDHGKAGEQLKQVASGLNLDLPSGPPAADRARIDKLKSATGAQFDHEFMAAMVEDHRKAVALFQKEANSNGNPDLVNFAKTTLPVLEEHAQMAHSIVQSESRTGKSS